MPFDSYFINDIISSVIHTIDEVVQTHHQSRKKVYKSIGESIISFLSKMSALEGEIFTHFFLSGHNNTFVI